MPKAIWFFLPLVAVALLYNMRPAERTRSDDIGERAGEMGNRCFRIYGSLDAQRKRHSNCEHACLGVKGEPFMDCIKACDEAAEAYGDCMARGLTPLALEKRK
jgi:hypothetical protein